MFGWKELIKLWTFNFSWTNYSHSIQSHDRLISKKEFINNYLYLLWSLVHHKSYTKPHLWSIFTHKLRRKNSTVIVCYSTKATCLYHIEWLVCVFMSFINLCMLSVMHKWIFPSRTINKKTVNRVLSINWLKCLVIYLK